jgi:ubiquinone/menaquinone biosynthesis C-methylase UbiE
MAFWYWFFGILGVITLLIFILGFPRKKSERFPSLEGLDDPDVAKSFEKMANFFPFKILRRRVVSELKKLTPSGVLADLGCGTGHLIVQIAKQFPTLKLIGVDISSEVLEFAKQRVIEERMQEKIEFREGNAETLPFEDGSLDYIVSTLSLHHWADPPKVVEEIYRVLKKGGRILIFDFRRDARKFFYGLLTFATKIVVPKPLKNINEPLGSLKAGYIASEISDIIAHCSFERFEIVPYLAWMFISSEK